MKNLGWLNFLIFICSLMIGYTISNRFYHPEAGFWPGLMRLVAAEEQDSLRAVSNGQHSILLVGASSVASPSPNLVSIWLATYFVNDSAINLLPIFPAGNQTSSDFEKQLARSFNFEKKNGDLALNDDFIQLLKKNNFWWDGYIVADEESLVQAFDLLGGIEINGQSLTGREIVDVFTSGIEDPRAAFIDQSAILQSACRKLSVVKSLSTATQSSSLLTQHVITDLDPSQLRGEFLSLLANNRQPSCKFPMLEISGIQ